MATFSRKPVSEEAAKKIAARVLIGADSFSGNTPVTVYDRGETFEVFFTHPVPEGEEGETYDSFAVVDKKRGDVLEMGVRAPEDND